MIHSYPTQHTKAGAGSIKNAPGCYKPALVWGVTRPSGAAFRFVPFRFYTRTFASASELRGASWRARAAARRRALALKAARGAWSRCLMRTGRRPGGARVPGAGRARARECPASPSACGSRSVCSRFTDETPLRCARASTRTTPPSAGGSFRRCQRRPSPSSFLSQSNDDDEDVDEPPPIRFDSIRFDSIRSSQPSCFEPALRADLADQPTQCPTNVGTISITDKSPSKVAHQPRPARPALVQRSSSARPYRRPISHPIH